MPLFHPANDTEWHRLRHRDVTSTEASALFGLSPYTLFVLRNTNGTAGQYRRAASNTRTVPSALTPKSFSGSLAAQSCDGCAAQ